MQGRLCTKGTLEHARCYQRKQDTESIAPKMLIMDQKVTTQAILGELDGRGVKFATLRMRSPGLLNRINALTSSDYKTVTLNRPGPHNKPRVHEDHEVKLTSYPGTSASSSSPASAGTRPPSSLPTTPPSRPRP